MVAVLLIHLQGVFAFDMNRHHVRLVLLVYHHDEIVEQHIADGGPGHQVGLGGIQRNLHAHGHAAAQHVVRVGDDAFHVHQPGRREHAVHGNQCALVGERRAIFHEQLELRGCRGIRAVGADVAVFAEDVEEMVSVHGEIHADGVNRGDVGQIGGRVHQVTNGDIGRAHGAIVRRTDDRVVQVNLCLVHGCFLLADLGLGGLHLGLRGLQGLLGISQVLLGNRTGFHQLGVALHIQLGLGCRGLG